MRGVHRMRNEACKVDVFHRQGTPGMRGAQQLWEYTLVFRQVSQQKSHVDQIVDGILVPFEDIALPEFGVSEFLLCGAFASDLEFYRIHVQARYATGGSDQTCDLKRDLSRATAEVKTCHALANSRSPKEGERCAPVGASHDFHTLLPRDSSMNYVVGHISSLHHGKSIVVGQEHMARHLQTLRPNLWSLRRARRIFARNSHRNVNFVSGQAAHCRTFTGSGPIADFV